MSSIFEKTSENAFSEIFLLITQQFFHKKNIFCTLVPNLDKSLIKERSGE